MESNPPRSRTLTAGDTLRLSSFYYLGRTGTIYQERWGGWVDAVWESGDTLVATVAAIDSGGHPRARGHSPFALVRAVAWGRTSVTATSVDTVLSQRSVRIEVGVAPLPGSFGVFTDSAQFFAAAAGATLKVSYPSPRALTTTPYTENGVTLTLASGGGNRVGELTPVLTGNEFCVDNRGTNLDITFATPVMAFGLWIVDGGEPVPSGDSADSRFGFTFLGTAGGKFGPPGIDPPVEQAFFVGFTFPSSVERVAIREAGSDGGPYDPRKEKDFLGRIYTK